MFTVRNLLISVASLIGGGLILSYLVGAVKHMISGTISTHKPSKPKDR